ncbi:MAG: hypothetical protein M1825_001687 [Sarcosagium campestre]|nr:MAG: hypothetical protein M1825_001687 [Sarcosagium campestre]
MNDPSSGVPPVLLPHVHLLSGFQFPLVAQMSVDTVVKYLTQAPEITRHTAPMTWQFIDAPRDGTVLLVWQAPQLATHFASDGYVWAEAEQAYSMDAKGYTVEMYAHRSGFHPPNEPVSAHARRRYRLTAASPPNSGASIDPSLWLVHYSASEPNHRYPANRVPFPPQLQQVLNTRRWLQTQGQLVRKEFMLHDRSNWPTINLPVRPMPDHLTHPSAGNANKGQLGRQPPFYNQSHGPGGAGPSSAKRQRQSPPRHSQGPNAALPHGAVVSHDMSFEQEEDSSRGDALDHLTPRQLSIMRLKNHQEWLEELFSSAYQTSQIMPVDLELGLKGELEDLTKGILDQPPKAQNGSGGQSLGVGKFEAGKVEAMKKRSTDKVNEINDAMDAIRKQHAARLEKLTRKLRPADGEKRLRNAVNNPDATGNEIWRLEGRVEAADDSDEAEIADAAPVKRERVDAIATEVAAVFGKHIYARDEVARVQDGGLERRAIPVVDEVADSKHEEERNAAVQRDVEMVNTATNNTPDKAALNSPSEATGHAAISESRKSPSQTTSAKGTPAPSNGPPAGKSQIEASAPSEVAEATGTGVEAAALAGQDTVVSAQQSPTKAPDLPDTSVLQTAEFDVDTEMSGLLETNDESNAGPDATTTENADWVMVGKDDGGSEAAATAEGATAAPLEVASDQAADMILEEPLEIPAAAEDASGHVLPDLTSSAVGQDHALQEPLDPTQFDDFGTLDTAGDALAGFDADSAGLSLDVDGGLDLDNSAFGDAFHGTDLHDDQPS